MAFKQLPCLEIEVEVRGDTKKKITKLAPKDTIRSNEGANAVQKLKKGRRKENIS